MNKLVLISMISGKKITYPLAGIKLITFPRVQFDGLDQGYKTAIRIEFYTGLFLGDFVADVWEMSFE